MSDIVEKPPLRYQELEVGRQFRPLVIRADAELVSRYTDTLGIENPLYTEPEVAAAAGLSAPVVPPGLWGIWGRAAYLVENSMPGGGVLAGEDLEYLAPLTVGQDVTVQARVVDRYIRKERPNVVFESSVADASGKRCGVIRIIAIWPAP